MMKHISLHILLAAECDMLQHENAVCVLYGYLSFLPVCMNASVSVYSERPMFLGNESNDSLFLTDQTRRAVMVDEQVERNLGL